MLACLPTIPTFSFPVLFWSYLPSSFPTLHFLQPPLPLSSYVSLSQTSYWGCYAAGKHDVRSGATQDPAAAVFLRKWHGVSMCGHRLAPPEGPARDPAGGRGPARPSIRHPGRRQFLVPRIVPCRGTVGNLLELIRTQGRCGPAPLWRYPQGNPGRPPTCLRRSGSWGTFYARTRESAGDCVSAECLGPWGIFIAVIPRRGRPRRRGGPGVLMGDCSATRGLPDCGNL